MLAAEQYDRCFETCEVSDQTGKESHMAQLLACDRQWLSMHLLLFWTNQFYVRSDEDVGNVSGNESKVISSSQVEFVNNVRCKSNGENVALACELAKSDRKLILSPLDRPKSLDLICFLLEEDQAYQSAQISLVWQGLKRPRHHLKNLVYLNFMI